VINPRLWKGGRPAGVEVDRWAGTVRFEWDQDAAMTPLGQLPFFIDFLKASGLFDAFVSDCPWGARVLHLSLSYVEGMWLM
jgi:hypothetical protein